MAIVNPTPEIRKAELPQVSTPTPANYWTSAEYTTSQYSSLIAGLRKDINTAVKDSGWSVQLREMYNFERAGSYVRPSVLQVEAGFYSYGKKQTTEYFVHIIEHLGLNSSNARLTDNGRSLQFMYRGVNVTITNFLAKFHEKHLYPESQVIPTLNGYNGEMKKLFNILLDKFGFSIDEYGVVSYNLKEGSEIYKSFAVAHPGFDCLTKILGTPRNMGSHGYFRTELEVANWVMASRYIGKSTFDIDESNNYVGPADYYGSSLFERIVNILRTGSGFDDQEKPSVLPPTIQKYQFKYWQEQASVSYRAMVNERTGFQARQMIRTKLSDSLISEATGILNLNEVKKFRTTFETSISQKEDFTFFVLSSSEETIKEKLADLARPRTN